MVQNHAGLYLEDADTTPTKLESMIRSLAENSSQLQEMQHYAFKMAKFDGVDKIVKQIKNCI